MALIIISAANVMAEPLSAMSSDDLVALLDLNAASSESGKSADSAKESAVASECGTPVAVTAHDMMTKVYGVLDSNLPKENCRQGARAALALDPEEEFSSLWLDTDSGYAIDFRGMCPEVSAMARFDNNDLSDFCFFFLFPRDEENIGFGKRPEHGIFCGSLLQEMHDMGLEAGADRDTDDLFNVLGSYEGNLVDVRLVDDTEGDRYILIVGVEPGAFSAADDLAAL